MANLRVHLAKKLGLIPEYGLGRRTGASCGSWTRRSSSTTRRPGVWAAAHHAFTRPHDEDLQYLETDPGRVNCYRYDLVLNGFEIGGGSIRLHDPEVQARVFKALGISDEEARAKFGFLLDALKLGAPPHGGIALGMDRLVMLLTGRRVAARRGRLPQDAEGHRPHDRRARRRRREAAARAVREEHLRAEVTATSSGAAPGERRSAGGRGRWPRGSGGWRGSGRDPSGHLAGKRAARQGS